jgi:fructose-1,6-bisphosphatase I
MFIQWSFIQTLINREIVSWNCILEEKWRIYNSWGELDSSHNNKYVVLMDPSDGSSNIDVNVSVKPFFLVYRRITPIKSVTIEDFYKLGTNQVVKRVGVDLRYIDNDCLHYMHHGVNGSLR